MSNTDSFIDEVTEEVRRDRLFALLKRYGWVGVVVVLAIVGGAAWREYSAVQRQAQAQAFGDALRSAIDTDAPADRAEALQAVTAPSPEGAAVTDMLAASELVNAEDPAAAAALLEQAASEEGLPEIYREIAAFKAVSRTDSGLSDDERRVRLEALAVPGKPLRLLAEEQLALLDIKAGESDAALEKLQRILQDAEITAGLRQRATQLIVALGGEPDAG
ncbi:MULTISPECIES: tetratricopeptide repeat protein [unclassified Salipiger]|uniref:tetratricopeptide repeat protein n=1 Tax=Salipiger sp. PrR002 TaxID=2706489 RepID=UPI0013B6DC48|nr:tetratricopeptide repeat protein [Salipiger sp. PrR002]NDW59600.1 tetratricopeptide repeat protein [Salipiger sp. PrR004]